MTRLGKVLSVAAALLLGLAGTAHATGLSQGFLSITNLEFSSGGTEVPVTDFASLNIQDKSALSATINGVGNTQTNSTTVLFPPLTLLGPDPFPLGAHECTNSTACTSTNTGTPYANPPTPPLTNLAKADSNLTGSPISGLIAGDPLATAQTAALAQLISGGAAASNSELTLSSNFAFTLGVSIPVTVTFNADAGVTSFLDSRGFAGTSSEGWSLVLRDTTVLGTLTWTPNGNAAADVIATGSLAGPTGISDPCSLQLQNSTTTVPSLQQTNCSGAFSLTTPTLTAGHAYTLDITHTSNGLINLVPEPTTLVLLGIGLGVVAVAGRFGRRRLI